MNRKGEKTMMKKMITLIFLLSMAVAPAYSWTARVNRYVNHTIQAGDTLEKLAKVYGTTIKSILRKNKLEDGSGLLKGKKIMIPVTGYEEKLIL